MDGGLHQHRSRQRISSRGFDPLLGGIGLPGSPGADMLATGLRVPYAVTGGGGLAPVVERYLFQLATIGIGEGLWLTGLGQLSVLGSEQGVGIDPVLPPIFPNVIEQTSSAFRFADCHPIRWGVRRVRKPRARAVNVLTTDSFSFRWTDNPGLVYETAAFPAAHLDWKGTPDNYLALNGYTAPYGGVFPGEPVGGDLGCFDSLDYPWSNPGRKAFEPVWVKPGGQLVFYALVEQTDSTKRGKLVVPAQFPLPTTGMPENAFVCDWPRTIQFAVGGWMEVEPRGALGEPV
ncbi:MAG: hypothetical protein KGI71_04785 [Patescibacteria group bacterium]|nr:hypothetical protein [Patescibacteria group bacterium]